VRIEVNGKAREVRSPTLALLLEELGLGDRHVATALNQEFVRAKDRDEKRLHEGDAVEIVSPRQGG